MPAEEQQTASVIAEEPSAPPGRRPIDIARRTMTGATKPHNWIQLVKFGAVGGSRIRHQSRLSSACSPRVRPSPARRRRILRRRHQQLHAQPLLDLRRRRRRLGLPGAALSGHQHRLARRSTSSSCSCSLPPATSASCLRRRSRSPSRCRSTSSATRCGRSAGRRWSSNEAVAHPRLGDQVSRVGRVPAPSLRRSWAM